MSSKRNRNKPKAIVEVDEQFEKTNDFKINCANEIARFKKLGFKCTVTKSSSIEICNESRNLNFVYLKYTNQLDFSRDSVEIFDLLNERDAYIKITKKDIDSCEYIAEQNLVTPCLWNFYITMSYGNAAYESLSSDVIHDWKMLYRYLKIATSQKDLIERFLVNEVKEIRPANYRVIEDRDSRANMVFKIFDVTTSPGNMPFQFIIWLDGNSNDFRHRNVRFLWTWRLIEEQFKISKVEFERYQAIYDCDTFTAFRGVYKLNLADKTQEHIALPDGIVE
jgi:hypothetical protein